MTYIVISRQKINVLTTFKGIMNFSEKVCYICALKHETANVGYADLSRDSVKQASLTALAAPSVRQSLSKLSRQKTENNNLTPRDV